MKADQSISEIARLLGRHRSTISRELSRGRGQRGYRAEQACHKAVQRAQHSRNARRVDSQVWADVASYLGLQWSPEQIAGRLAVSHESVYLHVYADKAAGGNLHQSLRSQKPRRKRYLRGQSRRGQIPNRRPISERPGHIDERKQVGHWEGDTVIGAAHKRAIVTLVERKSDFAVLAKVSNKTANLVGQAIEDKLGPLSARVKTLTVDNGKEFANHQAIDQALGIQTYFADPYCSWQRGSNENFNGLLHQYIPKKRRMEPVTTPIQWAAVAPARATYSPAPTPRSMAVARTRDCCVASSVENQAALSSGEVRDECGAIGFMVVVAMTARRARFDHITNFTCRRRQ